MEAGLEAGLEAAPGELVDVDDDGSSSEAEATGPFGGWVPPDDRLWRHPSELSGMEPAAAGDLGSGGRGRGGSGGGGGGRERGPGGSGGGDGHGWGGGGGHGWGGNGDDGRHLHPDRTGGRHRQGVATGMVGLGAVAAVAAGVLLLGASAGSGHLPTGASPRATMALSKVSGCCRLIPSAVREVRRATVSLQVDVGRTGDQKCAIAVAPGGLVATTADAVEGATSMTAVTAGGRRVPAELVAIDRGSDIALIRVGDDLPVPTFDEGTDASPGERAVALALTGSEPSGTERPGMAATGGGRAAEEASMTTTWSPVKVVSVGAEVTGGPASGLAGIAASVGPMPPVPGEVLMQPDGRVLGILDGGATTAGDSGARVFLPAPLVVGVSEALATEGRIRHGWLDVIGDDASPGGVGSGPGRSGGPEASVTTTSDVSPGGGGALIVEVEADGAASSALRPGDVIVSVDHMPVRSMAELRSRLYVLKPRTRVVLGVLRGGAVTTVAVYLSTSP